MRATTVRGAARLAADGVVGVSTIAEALQAEILARLPLASTGVPRIVGQVAGLAHRSVRGIARGIGAGLDRLLERAAPAGWHGDGTDAERRLRAIANGVFGDHLAASGNVLALPMHLRIGGRSVDVDTTALAAALPRARPRMLLMVHGLCMSAAQWTRGTHDHGVVVAAAHDFELVHVEYNSGLPIADNGARLAELLQRLGEAWPVELTQLAIVGHSMGGLVARSAIHQATAAGHDWPRRLRDLVFLGTPHHGAPLERIGHAVDRLLLATPWSAPFALLGRARSAGIVDLRHGTLLAGAGARSTPVPLPRGVRCRAVAGSLHPPPTARARQWVGDGLVPLDSALGRHPEADRELRFARGSQRVVDGAGHFDLLSDPRVAQQLVTWLAPAARGRR
jgi:hypothetical protein